MRLMSWRRIASRAIRELVENKIEKVEQENRRLADKIEEFAEIEEFCASIGFEYRHRFGSHRAMSKIQELKDGLPPGFIGQLNTVISGLSKVRESLGEENRE